MPTDAECCKRMLLGAKHVDNQEREVHFHSEKSSSRGQKPAAPLSKIHFFVSSRREAQWGEIRTVSVFNRKGKRVWVRGGDHSFAFPGAPASKGWSCFYGKSLGVEEKAANCTRSTTTEPLQVCNRNSQTSKHLRWSLSNGNEHSHAARGHPSLFQGILIFPLY